MSNLVITDNYFLIKINDILVSLTLDANVCSYEYKQVG